MMWGVTSPCRVRGFADVPGRCDGSGSCAGKATRASHWSSSSPAPSTVTAQRRSPRSSHERRMPVPRARRGWRPGLRPVARIVHVGTPTHMTGWRRSVVRRCRAARGALETIAAVDGCPRWEPPGAAWRRHAERRLGLETDHVVPVAAGGATSGEQPPRPVPPAITGRRPNATAPPDSSNEARREPGEAAGRSGS